MPLGAQNCSTPGSMKGFSLQTMPPGQEPDRHKITQPVWKKIPVSKPDTGGHGPALLRGEQKLGVSAFEQIPLFGQSASLEHRA